MKDIFVYIDQQLDRVRRKRIEHEDLAKELHREESRLGAMLVQLKVYICKSCKGRGKILFFYAQDDSKLVPCSVCNGTGESSERTTGQGVIDG